MLKEKKIKLCFIGNPNVGKSTLINRLLNSNELQKDHEISVWWSELDGCEPVLNIPEVMQSHCLRKYPAEKI